MAYISSMIKSIQDVDASIGLDASSPPTGTTTITSVDTTKSMIVLRMIESTTRGVKFDNSTTVRVYADSGSASQSRTYRFTVVEFK